MDLITFLRARLDEDEQTARAAGNRHWLVQDNIIELYPEREDDGFMRWPTRADARHAANWDPARVLAEVAAWRRILDEHASEDGDCSACGRASWEENPGAYLRDEPEMVDVWRPAIWPCRTIRLLALPYADHVDYREGWRP